MKNFYFLLLILVSLSAASQESPLVNKHGRVILPQAGEYAIGLPVNPLIEFIGNSFNGSTHNNFALGLLDGNAFYGKYFLAPDRALRVKADIYYVIVSYPSEFINETRMNSTHLTGGYEYRRGENRFQLVYGPEIILGLNSRTDKIAPPFTDEYTRKTKTNSLGVRGFLGGEYFFMPKLSLAAEMGLTFNTTIGGRVETPDDKRDVKITTLRKDILSGQIVLMFHL
jgi:hypothetical protein